MVLAGAARFRDTGAVVQALAGPAVAAPREARTGSALAARPADVEGARARERLLGDEDLALPVPARRAPVLVDPWTPVGARSRPCRRHSGGRISFLLCLRSQCRRS